MRLQSRKQEEDPGWISMVDLLVVVICIGIFMLGGIWNTARQSAARVDAAESNAGRIAVELERSRQAAGEWQASAQSSQERLDRIRRITGDSVAGDQDAEEALKSLIASAERASQLQTQLEKVNGEQAKFQKTIAELEAERASERKVLGQLREELMGSAAELSELRQRQVEARSELEAMKAQLKMSEDGASGVLQERDDFKGKADHLASELKSVEQQYQTQLDASGRIKQELLGLPGALANVVFVVDRSESMNRGGRWEDAKRTIGVWVRFLPVRKFALVAFSSDAQTIPGEMQQDAWREFDSVLIPEATEELRSRMLGELAQLSPRGQTQTLLGLRKAMEFRQIDAIVLFTDGAPDAGGERGGSDAQQEILTLVRNWKASHPSARIHTVGIGDYFNPKMRDFLLGIANETGGAFIGR